MARGGKRDGAGRKAGKKLPATMRKVDTLRAQKVGIKVAAMRYSDMALDNIVKLAKAEDNPPVRLGACREILDRAYGKPTQYHGADDENPLEVINKIILVAGGE